MDYNQKTFLLTGLIFLIFFIPRVFSLGQSMVSDGGARFWQPRSRTFRQAVLEGDWEKTYRKYHPGVTVMWLSGFSEHLFEKVAEFKLGRNLRNEPRYEPYRQIALKLPLVFVISAVGALCFYLFSKVVNPGFAFLALLFLSLEPFFLGISRYVHVSALVGILPLAVLAAAYVYLKTRKLSYLVLAGIFFGFSVLTKIVGMVAGVSVFVLFLVEQKFWKYIKKWSFWKQYFLEMLVFGCTGFLAFFLCFPAMWVDVVGVCRRIINEGAMGVAFSGIRPDMIVDSDFTYYLEIFVFRSTPVAVIFFFLAFYYFFSAEDTEEKKASLASLIFFAVTWIALSYPSKLKDRYLVDLYPYTSVLSAYGFWEFTKNWKRSFKIALGVVFVLFYISIFVRYHPEYSFYYNDALGGAAGREELGLSVKNRGEYYAQAALYLNSLAPEPEICNKNAIVLDRERIPSFKDHFMGKTFPDYSMMPKGYHAHFFVTDNRYLSQVPETCSLIKEFGPLIYPQYTALYVYDCNKTVDNTYAD